MAFSSGRDAETMAECITGHERVSAIEI
jgi:hypothetical protein